MPAAPISDAAAASVGVCNARAVVSCALVLAVQIPAAPVVGLMTLGVVVALVGHISRAPKLVGVGLAVLFLATAAMVLGAYISFQGDQNDPRPARAPGTAGF